jgi:hypothetical protein
MSQDFKRKLTYILGGTVFFILIIIVSSSLTRDSSVQKIEVRPTSASSADTQQEITNLEVNSTDDSAEDIPAEVLALQEEMQQRPGRRTEKVLTSDSPGFSVDDLAHLDLGFNQPEKNQASTEVEVETVIVLEASEPVSPKMPQTKESTKEEYPSMQNVSFKKCGEITVPTGLGLAMFSVTLQNNPVVECLGEAVASFNCSAHEAQISMDGSQTALYVMGRSDDGACSVGVPTSGSTVSMCSVESLMNVGFAENKTFAQWRQEFNEDPGKSFSSLYFENSAAFQNGNSLSQYDCKLYEI